jgi:hypothetical protein
MLFFGSLGLVGVDRSCLDAADSTYLITSRALADGQMPYRDFLVAHPPLLFLIGAPLAKLGAGVIPFRIFTLLLGRTGRGSGAGLTHHRQPATGDSRWWLTLFAPWGSSSPRYSQRLLKCRSLRPSAADGSPAQASAGASR